MRNSIYLSVPLQAAVFVGGFVAAFLLAGSGARAQISGAVDVNLSQKTGDDNECAISKNPSNKLQLFALCNTGGPRLVAAPALRGLPRAPGCRGLPTTTGTTPTPTDR